jgi:hypothetical protein
MPGATLDPASIARTVDMLQRRVEARFPDAGLGRVAEKLAVVARKAQETSEWIDRPILGLRIAVGALIVLIVLGLGVTVVSLRSPAESFEIGQFIQVLEAGINDVVLIGAAVFFLATLETRIKRRRALKAIHELRSIAHIVDMHQLTKDPEWVLRRGPETGVVERRVMSAFELGRYLDYCSEMLALTGKVAAVYIQRFEDPVALQAVNEVEDLTTGLSRKIWQKLMVLYTLEERRASGIAGGA